MSGSDRDYDRLASATAATAMPALGLALLSAAILAGFALASAELPAAGLVAGILFFWLHGIFIATLAWRQVKTRGSLLQSVAFPGLPAGAVLALPLLAFAMLDTHGASYFCGDGMVYGRSAIPHLPWLWIGWTILVLAAIPTRVLGLVIREQPPLIPLWRRAMLALPFLPMLLIVGYLFQWREIDCTPPFEGFGLFEGGLFALPLLGLFLFLLSFSMAVLAGVSVDPQAGGPTEGTETEASGRTG